MACVFFCFFFFFSSRRRHTRLQGDWSSDVCSSDLLYVTSSEKPSQPAVCFAVQGRLCAGSNIARLWLDRWRNRRGIGGGRGGCSGVVLFPPPPHRGGEGGHTKDSTLYPGGAYKTPGEGRARHPLTREHQYP